MFVLTYSSVFLCLTLSSVTALVDPNSFRLPNNVIPVRYDIELITDIHKMDMNFMGSVKIVIQVLNDTNEVVIHKQYLNITDSTVRLSRLNEMFEHNKNVVIKNMSYVGSNNFFTIETNLADTLFKDEFYLIQMEYAGIINNQPTGFYAVSQLNEYNETVLSAMTNFKPTYARQMFPCFDEPHLKAIFSLVVRHGNNVTAISNMPGSISIVPGDLIRTTFPDTPQMSTYSVALILTNLTDITTGEDTNKIVHQVYSTFEGINQLDLLLQTSQKLLPTFVSTLRVNYRLPQLVQVVLVDSNINRSSNWGVITYHDSSIYYDSTDYFYQQQENIIKEITHEIAKQFLGNTVSPEWWNFAWLIEGLIVVTSNIVLNIDYPSYRAIDDFVVNVKLNTMIMDRNGDIPILEYDIESFEQIIDLLSATTKSKAACIIYMMMHATREDIFHESLMQYLSQNENSTINTNTFFGLLDTLARNYGALSTAISLSNITNTWSSQKGVPLLTVNRDYTSGSITVTQTVLGSTGTILEWWSIPYNFIVKREAKLDPWLTIPHGWFELRSYIISIQPNVARNWSSTDWILFNKKSTGYYRVNYDQDNWYLLITDLMNSATFPLVHYLNRAQLIDDSFVLAQEKIVTYDIPLKLAQFLQYETEHFVWQSFYPAYQFLERILFETDVYDRFSVYINSLAGKIYDTLEMKNYHDVLTQKMLINMLCRASYYNCLQATTKTVAEFLNNPDALPQNLEEEYLHNGIRFIDANSVSTLFTKAMTSTDADMRSLIFNGLGFTTNRESIEMLMKATITDNNQIINDITINLTNSERKLLILSLINNNQAGFKFVLEFLRTELDIYRRIMINEIPDILKSLSMRIGTSDSYVHFQILVDVYKNLQNQATLYKYLENAKTNVDWLDNRLDEIRTNLPNTNDGSNAITIFVPFSLILISQVVLIYKICV